MAVHPRRRQALALTSVLGLLLAATACSDDGGNGDTATGSDDCAAFEKYAGNEGKKVSIYASIRDTEAELLEESWSQFAECTEIEIEYEGSGEFEAQLPVRVDGGNPPDLAFIPQPGLLKRFADGKKLKPAPADAKAAAEANYPANWLGYSTVGGTFYGAPLASNVKSFVWYSPKTFQEKGWAVPKTWDELIKLSDTIAASGVKPWCAGVESGDATGWPATDWLEDLMLRTAGPDVYDQWVTHQIAFNDPRVKTALDQAGQILKNPKYVNGGYGDVKSIVSTSFQEGGLPVRDGKCAMHRQASFYANQWPEGTTVAEDGDVFAFYFPTVDPAKGEPLLAAGEFVTAFTDRPEVQAVQNYLATPDYHNARAKLGNWVSGSKGLDIANVKNPIDKLSVELLNSAGDRLRFDGSDLMPSSVGAGTLWRGMVQWLNGANSTTVLNSIEGSWPK
ncbi:MAG TPA: ABC transporter substrate-binding protein [Pilimelia sp.]|nr:ABC transporter substrate-binding protein [Pilimelia sp.]